MFRRRSVFYAMVIFGVVISACGTATVAPTAPPPTVAPLTAAPTVAPTTAPPTIAPTEAPTTAPTVAPTIAPTVAPTSAPTAAPTTAPVTGDVSFMVFGSPNQVQAYQALATAFETKYPGTKVDLISLADNEEDYHAKLAIQLAGGVPPDVVIIDYDAAARYFAAGAFQSLTTDMAQSTVIHATDFYTQAYDAFQWRGQQMCVPMSISSVVVYYNKKLFDAAGLAYPKAGWTWDQFIATAKALTKAPDQFGVGMDRELNNVLPFIWQNGGELFTPDGKATALDSPAATAAIQFWVDWQTKDHISPNAVQEQSEDSGSRFQDGTMGMFLDSSDSVPDLRAVTTGGPDWDVGPLPQSQQAATILKSTGVCLPTKAPRPDLAWKLIEYINSTDGQKLVASAGLSVPSNMSVAQSPAFLDPNARPAHAQVWLDAIPFIRSVPPLPHWPDIEEAANTELESAFYGNETVAAAVKAIAARAKIALQP